MLHFNERYIEWSIAKSQIHDINIDMDIIQIFKNFECSCNNISCLLERMNSYFYILW